MKSKPVTATSQQYPDALVTHAITNKYQYMVRDYNQQLSVENADQRQNHTVFEIVAEMPRAHSGFTCDKL